MNSMMRESWQQYRFFDAGFRMANPCEFSLNMFAVPFIVTEYAKIVSRKAEKILIFK